MWLPVIGATLKLDADEAYIHFSYTDPAMRGFGVQPAVANFMMRWEIAARIHRHYYFVMRHNVSAMKITTGQHAARAAIPSRTIRTIRVLGAHVFFVVGLGGERRPQLEPAQHSGLGRLVLAKSLPWTERIGTRSYTNDGRRKVT